MFQEYSFYVSGTIPGVLKYTGRIIKGKTGIKDDKMIKKV